MVKIDSNEGVISQIPGSKFYYLDNQSSTVVLEINRFGSKEYKDYYKEVFAKLKKDQIENLVIDLRNNGGGYFPNSTNFLRYLLDDNISMEFSNPRMKVRAKENLSQGFSEKMTSSF